MTGVGHCNLCQRDVRTVELLSHFDLYHPDFMDVACRRLLAAIQTPVRRRWWSSLRVMFCRA